jgi:hypothetical protein
MLPIPAAWYRHVFFPAPTLTEKIRLIGGLPEQ